MRRAHQQGSVPFCDTCKCSVSGPWEIHTAGIRHQRKTLSLQHFHDANVAVVSVFESLPEAGPSTYRSRDPVVAKKQRNKPNQPDTSVSGTLSAVLRQLVHETGTGGHLYRAASKRFTLELLQEAKLSHQRILERASRTGTYVHALNTPPAQLAYLAHALPLPPPVHTITINLPFQTQGPESVATTSAVRLLAHSLRRDTRIAHVRIDIDPQDYVMALVQGGTGFHTLTNLWGKALAAFRTTFASNGILRSLHLHAPPGILPTGELAQLQAAMSVLPGRLRGAVMMGQHRRLGCNSQLHRLPQQLAEAILDMAVPRQPCQLVMSTATVQLPGQGSSDSSSSEGSSSSDDNEDSDDGGDSSESGASGN